MTRTGYEKIRAQVAHMENEEAPKIAQRIADARDEGDLSENAEFHGALESQGMLNAKIAQLKHKLALADIIETGNIPRDEVGFSATVVVRDIDFDDEEEFTFVGAGEEDYETGKILSTSPLAQGLMGKKVGEQVEIPVPKGTLKFEILEIRYED